MTLTTRLLSSMMLVLLSTGCPPPLEPETDGRPDAGLRPMERFTQRTLPDGGTLSSGRTLRLRIEPRTRPDGSGRTLSTNALIASLESVTLWNGTPFGEAWNVFAQARDGSACCTPLPRVTLGPNWYVVPAQTFRVKAGTPLRVQVPASPSMAYETASDLEVRLLEDAPLTDLGAGQPAILPFAPRQAEIREDFGQGLSTDPVLVTWSLELTR